MTKIICTKKIFDGKPIISGTRISVDVIGDYIINGYGIKEIHKDYPHLTKEQILVVLDYIARKTAQERIKLEPKTS